MGLRPPSSKSAGRFTHQSANCMVTHTTGTILLAFAWLPQLLMCMTLFNWSGSPHLWKSACPQALIRCLLVLELTTYLATSSDLISSPLDGMPSESGGWHEQNGVLRRHGRMYSRTTTSLSVVWMDGTDNIPEQRSKNGSTQFRSNVHMHQNGWNGQIL